VREVLGLSLTVKERGPERESQKERERSNIGLGNQRTVKEVLSSDFKILGEW